MWTRGVAGVLALCSTMAMAGDVLSSANEPVAKQIQAAADAICRPGDEDDAGGEASVPAPMIDLSCAVSAQEVLAPVTAGRLHVVDLRSVESFNGFHINGALNIGGGELPAKTYLREARLLLVGSGKGERALYETCHRLRSGGFRSVHVLRGGMLAWLGVGGPVLGEPPALAPLRQLAPGELIEETYFPGNLFVFLPGTQRLTTTVPAESSLVLLKSARLGVAVPQRLRARTSTRAVILVATDPAEAHAQAQLLQKMIDVPVLVYADGVAAYQEAQRRQQAVVASRERPPRPRKCAL